MVIALFENLPGQLEQALPNLVGMLLAELSVLIKKKKPNQAYLLMLLQTIAVGFYNSCGSVFAVLESNGMTQTVMQQWLLHMKHFKKEAELRRVLFGLAAVARGEGVPEGVLASIAEVGQQIVELSMSQVEGREEYLADNLKHLDEEGDDDDSSENGEMSADSAENSEEEFKKIKAKL